MATQTITEDMKVWDVIHQHPETYEVFRQFGCPDMRTGIFAVSAHIMNVRWAARFHHIALDQLLTGLNTAIADEEGAQPPTRH